MNQEVINKILEFSNNDDYKRLSCDEIAILKDYITNLEKAYQNAVDHAIVSNKYASKKEDEVIELQAKIKIDIDLLKNYEFDKYNWNYMEQQAVAEYLEKEILKEGEENEIFNNFK